MDYLALYNIFGTNGLIMYKFFSNLLDVLMMLDLLMLFYMFFFSEKDSSMIYILLFHGSLPLAFTLMSMFQINGFISMVLMLMGYYFLSSYLASYELFVIVVMIVNNTSMIFFMLYRLFLKHFSFRLNFGLGSMLCYSQMALVLLYFDKALFLHEVLVAVFVTCYLLHTYGIVYMN